MDVIKDLEIKLRKIILNYLSGLSVLTRVLIREKQRSERGENAAGLEYEGRSHKPENTGSL